VALTSTPHSVNEFKKFAGFMGFVTVGGNPAAGLQVRILKPDGSTLTTVTTDADGFYFYAYQHKSKSATYKVRLLAYYPTTPEVAVTVKANGFAVVNFTVP
jgi:5-hydroxyisourate hydrolase-like protein (transthyretin family)